MKMWGWHMCVCACVFFFRVGSVITAKKQAEKERDIKNQRVGAEAIWITHMQQIYTCVRVCICIHICIYKCIYTCIRIMWTYMYIHVYK